MKKILLKSIWFVLVFIGSNNCFGQKPAAIQINSLISRIPIPTASQSCFEGSTTIKDPDGTYQIKDNGPVFNALTNEVESFGKTDMDAMKNGDMTAQTSAPPAAPTPEQIAQMQDEAMKRAQLAQQNGADPSRAAQSSNSYKPPVNVALMQELGKAQSAVGQINQLTMEMSSKMGEIRMQDVPGEPNCPEVRQGSYVGPTCACERQRNITHYEKMVAARNTYLQKVDDLLHKYILLIQNQVAVIDKVEADAKYGQGITDPRTIQMLWSVQRMGLNGFNSVMGIASSSWSEGAKQYLYVLNATARTCPPL
jgi:hypothetical protein